MSSKARREHRKILAIIRRLQKAGVPASHSFNEKTGRHIYEIDGVVRRSAFVGMDWNYRSLSHIRGIMERYEQQNRDELQRSQ